MNNDQISALRDEIRIWAPEDFEETTTLRAIADDREDVPAEMVQNLRNLHQEYEAMSEEVKDIISNASDEDLKAVLKSHISDFVDDQIESETEDIQSLVSDWFNDHCKRSDFDNSRERLEYLEELANGTGDLDYIYDCVIEEVEAKFLTEEEIDDTINEAIQDEADYWYSTSQWD